MANCKKEQIGKIKPNSVNDHLPKNKGGLLDMQWNHDAVKAKEALAICKLRLGNTFKTQAAKIKVMQLDTGWSDHPSIAGKLYRTDLSANYIHDEPDVTGKDTLCNKGLGKLDPGHGTSTAFTLIGNSTTKRYHQKLSTTGKNKVIKQLDTQYNKGLFPYVEFIPVRINRHTVFNLTPRVKPHISLMNGVKLAIQQKVDIISLCMGGDGMLPHKERIIRQAAKLAYDNGILFICAAGNTPLADNLVGVVIPAEFPFTIAAGGVETYAWVDKKDENKKEQRIIPWKKGVCGPQVDISAPAKFVFTALKLEGKNAFKFGKGTSQATMHVVAAACMWLLVNKKELQDNWFTTKKARIVEAFRWALQASKNLPEYWSVTNKALSSGILNIENLLSAEFAPAKFKANPKPYFDVTRKEILWKLDQADRDAYKKHKRRFIRHFNKNVIAN